MKKNLKKCKFLIREAKLLTAFFLCHLARMPFTPGVVPAGVNRRPRSVGKTAINLQLYSDATSRAFVVGGVDGAFCDTGPVRVKACESYTIVRYWDCKHN